VAGSVRYDDPAGGPLFAEAANSAINPVVTALRNSF
jgi:hypothetical protein